MFNHSLPTIAAISQFCTVERDRVGIASALLWLLFLLHSKCKRDENTSSPSKSEPGNILLSLPKKNRFYFQESSCTCPYSPQIPTHNKEKIVFFIRPNANFITISCQAFEKMPNVIPKKVATLDLSTKLMVYRDTHFTSTGSESLSDFDSHYWSYQYCITRSPFEIMGCVEMNVL